jgi:heat-inducible transcriptional repressor
MLAAMAVPLDHAPGAARLGGNSLARLNERSREIFRLIVDTYLAHGEAVGSRYVARLLPAPLSPASVRNVMQDLEEIGLIYAPHTSAGRLPTELGLRFFVDALLELGDVSQEERERIEAEVKAASQEQTLEGLVMRC